MGTTQILLVVLGAALFIELVILAIRKFSDAGRIRKKYADSDDRTNVFVKKYKEADIDYYHGFAARIGFVVVILLLIAVFNFTRSGPTEKLAYNVMSEEIIEQDIPVTKQTVRQQPPPPPPPPRIEVVEDERVIEEEVAFVNQDIDLDAEIEIFEDTARAVNVEVPVAVEVEEEPEEEIFVVVEQRPEFPGGEAALMEYLSSNIQYPQLAEESAIEGTVVLRFVVDETGGISDIVTLKNIGGGCGEEAARVVGQMPRWQPGRQRGKAVKVYYTLPVRFKLQ